MKAIESSVEMLQEEFDVNATKEQLVEKVYEEIERAGRLCYKSEDKIGDGTAKAFVDMLVNAGHNAMLEHGTVYLRIPIEEYEKNYKNKYFPQE